MSTGRPSPSFRTLLQDRRSLGVIIGLMATIGGLLLLCIFAFLILSPGEQDDPVVATPTLGAISSGGQPVVDVPIISSDLISLTVDSPLTLQVAGQTFNVQTQVIPATGQWVPASNQADTALWIYGTVVNYVLGVPDSVDNRALFDRLVPGDDLILTTRANHTLQFDFNSREVVSVSDQDVFAQHEPGITLVLMGTQGDQRLVIRGRHAVTEANASNNTELPTSFELGETAPLGNLQVTVTGATHLLNRPEAPNGFAFYLIEYQVQNIGTIAFDTTLLTTALFDSFGNQYATNGVASTLGKYPALFGSMNPSQLAQTTVGYQIPLELSGPNLRWRLIRTDTNAFIEVTIPFADQATTAQSAEIKLLAVEVSVDGTNVMMSGEITNLGQQALVVSESDLTLHGDDGGVYLLLSTNPGFPWVVNPGTTSVYQVMFQRPSGSQALLTILNQPFQLSGLR